MRLKPIGVIRSPFFDLRDMPIQPAGARGKRGAVEVFEAYQDGLAGLEGFSHIILIYRFHRSRGYSLKVVPFMDSVPRGVFATRAPRRPNALGLSVVRLAGMVDGVLQVENVDILDGTPLLDIKPYVPDFDAAENASTGWLARTGNDVRMHRSDNRFSHKAR